MEKNASRGFRVNTALRAASYNNESLAYCDISEQLVCIGGPAKNPKAFRLTFHCDLLFSFFFFFFLDLHLHFSLFLFFSDFKYWILQHVILMSNSPQMSERVDEVVGWSFRSPAGWIQLYICLSAAWQEHKRSCEAVCTLRKESAFSLQTETIKNPQNVSPTTLLYC